MLLINPSLYKCYNYLIYINVLCASSVHPKGVYGIACIMYIPLSPHVPYGIGCIMYIPLSPDVSYGIECIISIPLSPDVPYGIGCTMCRRGTDVLYFPILEGAARGGLVGIYVMCGAKIVKYNTPSTHSTSNTIGYMRIQWYV